MTILKNPLEAKNNDLGIYWRLRKNIGSKNLRRILLSSYKKRLFSSRHDWNITLLHGQYQDLQIKQNFYFFMLINSWIFLASFVRSKQRFQKPRDSIFLVVWQCYFRYPDQWCWLLHWTHDVKLPCSISRDCGASHAYDINTTSASRNPLPSVLS